MFLFSFIKLKEKHLFTCLFNENQMKRKIFLLCFDRLKNNT